MVSGLTSYSPTYACSLSPIDSADQAQDTSVSARSRSKRGVADPTTLWPQGSTIKISLQGMTKEQEQFTKDNINKWAPHVNLKFEFTDQPGADIRIKGDDTSSGGGSQLGIEAKTEVKADEPTMTIGFQDQLGAYTAQTIQHEFGHALGLEHEHQHPNSPLDFDFDRIRQDYDPEYVSDNYYKLHIKTVTSAYDQKSVMHYSIDSEYLYGAPAIPENVELSEGDKRFISSLYPKPKPQPNVRFCLKELPFREI
ncbi:M12 family metallopeptidase [Pseudomonas graminis]